MQIVPWMIWVEHNTLPNNQAYSSYYFQDNIPNRNLSCCFFHMRLMNKKIIDRFPRYWIMMGASIFRAASIQALMEEELTQLTAGMASGEAGRSMGAPKPIVINQPVGHPKRQWVKRKGIVLQPKWPKHSGWGFMIILPKNIVDGYTVSWGIGS